MFRDILRYLLIILCGVVLKFVLHQVYVLTADAFILTAWEHAKGYANKLRPGHQAKALADCPDCAGTLYNLPQ